MLRGEFVTIATQGDFGKPRPALIIQGNQYAELTSVTVLLVTSTLIVSPLLRVIVEPDEKNGLKKTSQAMLDKIMTVKRDKVGEAFGVVDAKTLVQIERCLAAFIGIVG